VIGCYYDTWLDPSHDDEVHHVRWLLHDVEPAYQQMGYAGDERILCVRVDTRLMPPDEATKLHNTFKLALDDCYRFRRRLQEQFSDESVQSLISQKDIVLVQTESE
jgi:hypothetical protein